MRHPSRRESATAASYLASRTRYGIKFGVETIGAIVEALGHPERAYACLLVAGTNGKGSVVAYVDSALRGSGLRVGRYTSPHLLRLNERIVVSGAEIGAEDLETVVAEVREISTSLVSSGVIPAHPTYFEALTATAFEHFRRQKVDVAVLEVGMGGRLDATNVSDPIVSAIVSVDFDHERFLGKTLGAIAHEKAGVLRAGRAAVLGPLSSEARSEVALTASRLGTRLVDALEEVRVTATAQGLNVRTPFWEYTKLRPLPGDHQRTNVVVALRLLEEARSAGLGVDLTRASSSIASTRWPGRLQWIPGDPPFLLDGAHNPAGARALARHLASVGPFVLLFGVMGDKDVRGLADPLFPLAEAVVLTRPAVSRALAPQEIVERAGPIARGAHMEAHAGRALALARKLSPRGHPVVVAGSLYLVGEVLSILSRRKF